MSRCAKLCSRALFTDTTNPDILKRICSGDASETAILKFMESVSPVVAEYRKRYQKLAEKPFSSVSKYQYSVHFNADKTDESGANFILVLKGAPERVIQLCTHVLNGNTCAMCVFIYFYFYVQLTHFRQRRNSSTY